MQSTEPRAEARRRPPPELAGIAPLARLSVRAVEPPPPPLAPEPAAASPAPRRVRRAPMQRCRADLSLVGTVVNERHPQLSRVVVRTRTGASVVAVGGRVEDFTVALVLPADAALRATDGALCTLGGFAAALEAPRPAPAPERNNADDARASAPRGKAVFSAQELADGVRLLANGEYLVSKAFLLKALTNPGGAAGTAWFRPAKREGQGTGMEVLGVRAGSALEAMGVRSGDVAQSINGIALDAASGLIAALRAARQSDHISLAIMRDGQPRALSYRIE